MKPFLHIIFIILAGFSPVFGQQNPTTRFVEVFSTGYDGSQMAYHIRPEGRYSEIKGTPYLIDDWRPGSVILKGDSVKTDFLIRFNVYGNEMQFIYKDDTFAIANPHKLQALWLDGRKFEYLPFTVNDNQQFAYFEVLAEGHTRLLKRTGIRLDSGQEPVTPYHCQNATARFVKTTQYYFQISGGEEVRELPESFTAITRESDLTRPGFREAIKAGKFRASREQDLITYFTWLNIGN